MVKISHVQFLIEKNNDKKQQKLCSGRRTQSNDTAFHTGTIVPDDEPNKKENNISLVQLSKSSDLIKLDLPGLKDIPEQPAV